MKELMQFKCDEYGAFAPTDGGCTPFDANPLRGKSHQVALVSNVNGKQDDGQIVNVLFRCPDKPEKFQLGAVDYYLTCDDKERVGKINKFLWHCVFIQYQTKYGKVWTLGGLLEGAEHLIHDVFRYGDDLVDLDAVVERHHRNLKHIRHLPELLKPDFPEGMALTQNTIRYLMAGC